MMHEPRVPGRGKREKMSGPKPCVQSLLPEPVKESATWPSGHPGAFGEGLLVG